VAHVDSHIQCHLTAFLHSTMSRSSTYKQNSSPRSIEDAHWIDEVSESMLADFLTVIPQTLSPVLITYRPEYTGALGRVPGAHSIALAPLSDPETATLVSQLLGPDPSVSELGQKIAERAAGNPFSPRRWCVSWPSAVCFADSPISWTSTRHDSCRPPSTARDGYTAGASYRNEWSESDHHQECRGRFGRKGTARHRAAHFEHVGTLSIASVVSILKVAVVVPPFEPRLQQIYADSSCETVQHQQQQAKHRLRPLSVRYCRWVAAPFTSRRIGRPQVRACRAVHDHARAFIPKQVLPVN